MRIISGTLGGRVLKTIDGEGYRPAMSRTREALFSMLEARGLEWQGTRVLDLFAGSGSLAFEAVSRGAAEALLVENAAPAVRCIVKNVENLGLLGRVYSMQEDVLRLLRRPPAKPYDLVFLDPPYGKNLVVPALTALAAHNWTSPEAFITAEVEKESKLTLPPAFTLLADRFFGRTRICIWTVS